MKTTKNQFPFVMMLKKPGNSCIIPVVFLLTLFLAACPSHGYKYNEGWLPEDPVPIADFNSEYNDYNMTEPTLGGIYPLAFSSDRASAGVQYDIISEIFEITFDKTNADLYAGRATSGLYQLPNYRKIQSAFPVINSTANELGPFIRTFSEVYGDYSDKYSQKYIVLFSSDRNGTQDIFLSYDTKDGDDSLSEFTIPQPVLASPDYNEAYPFFDEDYSIMYFCSDQEGNYDIYSMPLAGNKDFISALSGLTGTPEALTVLNSEKNDKCPYIVNNLLVFCSDREGGYGGFDLYYSLSTDTGWSAPINLGTRVNSEYNEYRPVARCLPSFKHDLLLFSSDRPGGKGGYDLYYAGIPRRIIEAQ